MILNYIWVAFFLIAFVVALFKLVVYGDMAIFPAMVDTTFEMARMAFEISIWLTGILALWMGFMKIGEKAGVVGLLARVVGPFFHRLFPDVPNHHKAMGAILMNFSANILGLDNAGTPLGLKAMQYLQELNPQKDTASNAQIMFLVLNTSGLTLIPITIIMYRTQLGAANPSDVFIPILLATLASSLAGLTVTALYQRINLLDRVLALYLLGIVGFMGLTIYLFRLVPESRVADVSNLVSNVVLFSVIIGFILMALRKRLNVYECFIDGAKDGFGVAVQIIPYLVAMLVAIGVFRASGALNAIIEVFRVGFELLGFDTQFTHALPTAFMKPLSGSGARGMMIDAMHAHGADSFAGRLACTMQGATDTTLYIIAVYFGSVNIRNTRYALWCGLVADVTGIIAAILINYFLFA